MSERFKDVRDGPFGVPQLRFSSLLQLISNWLHPKTGAVVEELPDTPEKAEFEATCPYADERRVRQFHLRDFETAATNPFAIWKTELSDDDEAVVEDVLRMIRLWQREVLSSGAIPLLVVLPFPMQIAGASPTWREWYCVDQDLVISDRPQQILAEFCTENGLECLDLLPLWREFHSRPIWKSPDQMLSGCCDSHWNDRGHFLAAEAIARKLGQIEKFDRHAKRSTKPASQ